MHVRYNLRCLGYRVQYNLSQRSAAENPKRAKAQGRMHAHSFSAKHVCFTERVCSRVSTAVFSYAFLLIRTSTYRMFIYFIV